LDETDVADKQEVGETLSAVALTVDHCAVHGQTPGVGEGVAGETLDALEGVEVVGPAVEDGGAVDALVVVDDVVLETAETVAVEVGLQAEARQEGAGVVVVAHGEVVAGDAATALQGLVAPAHAVGHEVYADPLVELVAGHAVLADAVAARQAVHG
jgi:hypothetical protein